MPDRLQQSDTSNSLVVGRNIHQEAEAKADGVPWSPLEYDSQCCVNMLLLNWASTVLIMKRIVSLLLIQPGHPALYMGLQSLGLEPAGVKVSSVSERKDAFFTSL